MLKENSLYRWFVIAVVFLFILLHLTDLGFISEIAMDSGFELPGGFFETAYQDLMGASLDDRGK